MDDKITASIEKGQTVTLWLSVNPYAIIDERSVNASQSIEYEMIKAIKPEWNTTHKNTKNAKAYDKVLDIINSISASTTTSSIQKMEYENEFINYLKDEIKLKESSVALYIRNIQIIPSEMNIPLTKASINSQEIVDKIRQHFTRERETNAQSAVQHYFNFLEKAKLTENA